MSDAQYAKSITTKIKIIIGIKHMLWRSKQQSMDGSGIGGVEGREIRSRDLGNGRS